jgi:hypothetical protein
MVQDGYFSFDSNVYPPQTGTGNTTLKDTDIVSQKILEFFRGVLQANMSSRWNEACLSCGLVNSKLQNMKDGYTVGDALCFPLPSTLQQTDYHFPVLSVYREKEQYRQLSTTHIVIESDFVINWVLPPLANVNQRNMLYPFLQEVSKTLLFYTFRGSDPKYNNGELVWREAGFAFALMEGAEYGSFLGQDGKTEFPSVQIKFKVFERDQFVRDNFESLTGFDGYIDHLDGYNINDPIVDFIEFHTNPGLRVTSFTPNSGPLSGNTMVVIYGTGFEEAGLSQQSQITLAGNAVLRFLVKSDTVMIVITGYAPSGTSGPVVITDKYGNVATSTQNFTYS